MTKLRMITAGESHGKGHLAILEGLPSGLPLSEEDINKHLARRQKGYGRGDRMKIETDKVEFLSGVRHGLTMGSPVTLFVKNKDWENWQDVMSASPVDLTNPEIQEKMEEKKIEFVRPGHADLSGTLKYQQPDIRNVLERSSARETSARVAVGGLCMTFLSQFGINVFSHIVRIGPAGHTEYLVPKNFEEVRERAENSPVRCADPDLEQEMINAIDAAKEEGDTLGGLIQIVVTGLPVGLGSYVHWDRKLDGRLSQAIMSIPAIKSVEMGLGKRVSEIPGSNVHDEITPQNLNGHFFRKTNNAGGLEGGMTNGEPLIIHAAMKPIPTLKKPLESVNFKTGEVHTAHYERSDVCAVPAAGVVCESMTSYVIADALMEKLGGDSLKEMLINAENYKQLCQMR